MALFHFLCERYFFTACFCFFPPLRYFLIRIQWFPAVLGYNQKEYGLFEEKRR